MPTPKPITLHPHRKPIKGKARTVHVKTEPLRHEFDTRALTRGPADAIRDTLERAIRSIARNASKSTLAKRRARGVLGSKLFNATGRLARGLRVEPGKDSAAITAPSDRFRENAPELLERLREVVPELEPRKLLKDRKVREAVQDTMQGIITKQRKG